MEGLSISRRRRKRSLDIDSAEMEGLSISRSRRKRFLDIDSAEDRVMEYINPISGKIMGMQGRRCRKIQESSLVDVTCSVNHYEIATEPCLVDVLNGESQRSNHCLSVDKISKETVATSESSVEMIGLSVGAQLMRSQNKKRTRSKSILGDMNGLSRNSDGINVILQMCCRK